MRILTTVLLAIFLLGGTGCVSLFTDPLGRRHALKMTQREYTNLMRWGEIERASELVDPEMRDEFLSYLPAFERIRITDYEIGKLSYEGEGEDEEREVANVTVTYRGYSVTSLTEESIREDQEWYRDGAGRTWLVRPQIAGIADALGGEPH